MAFRFVVTGMDETLALLGEAAPREIRNLVRATIHGVAVDLASEIKMNAPEDSGDMKKSIKAKRLKGKKNYFASAVTISNKTHASPARPDGTYKWVHIEFGTQENNAQPFVGPARDRKQAVVEETVRRVVVEKMEKMLKAKQRRAARAGG